MSAKIVHARFDCHHDRDVEVSIDEDIEVPETVRGIGKCPDCMEEDNLIAISGVAPLTGGRSLVLDNVMMMPIG